jgi:hypothetical protein
MVQYLSENPKHVGSTGAFGANCVRRYGIVTLNDRAAEVKA